MTTTEPAPRRVAPAFVFVVTLLVLALPLAVALTALHHPRWYPLGDIAQTEMRVRDVASAHPPLIGLPGRIGAFPRQGSHPGPLSFYAIFPAYRAFGASAFALQCATALLQLGAMALALWVAWRRGGPAMMLAIAAVLAVLAHNLGFDILIEPWNPYLPVMLWVAFVLAVWSVACGDLALLPIVAVVGSFCVQTHVSYVGPVCGLGAFAIGAAFVVARRRAWPAVLASIGVGAIVWVPPIVEQFTTKHGNITELLD
jgi:hypothetical protein